MINLGPHAAFILGSYVASVAIIAALTIAIVLDNRARKRELAAFDAKRTPETSR